MENERKNGNDLIRIAVVEDDNTVREGLKILLDGSEGIRCVAACSSGEEAVGLLPGLQPNVVLMDINLPGMNGIECVLTLKLAHPAMQFIMLTVFENSENIFNSLKAGASGYLLKHTPPAKLIESVIEVYRGGSPMSTEIARKVVQSFQSRGSKSKVMNLLTKREEEILSSLAKGFLYKEIADHLNISMDTVRSHIRHIYEKLQVNSRTEAVIKYLEK